MGNTTFKLELNEQFARVAKALANPHRLEVVNVLAQGERSVEEVSHEIGLSIANTSQHLQAMREAHLVSARKAGQRVYYRLADADVYRLTQLIRTLAERQLAEVGRLIDTYLNQRSILQAVTLEELQARLSDPDLVILDVRPSVEYINGHIAGARSIPIDELARRLEELPRTQEIVAYCRGPYCVYADEAVQLLTAHGYIARRMSDGYPEWQLANYPTVSKGQS